jgi:hypothetical protein
MKRLDITLALFLTILTLLPFDGLAWNIPGHMLSGAIAYHILQREPNYDSCNSLNSREESLVRIPLESTIGETAGSRT